MTNCPKLGECDRCRQCKNVNCCCCQPQSERRSICDDFAMHQTRCCINIPIPMLPHCPSKPPMKCCYRQPMCSPCCIPQGCPCPPPPCLPPPCPPSLCGQRHQPSRGKCGHGIGTGGTSNYRLRNLTTPQIEHLLACLQNENCETWQLNDNKLCLNPNENEKGASVPLSLPIPVAMPTPMPVEVQTETTMLMVIPTPIPVAIQTPVLPPPQFQFLATVSAVSIQTEIEVVPEPGGGLRLQPSSSSVNRPLPVSLAQQFPSEHRINLSQPPVSGVVGLPSKYSKSTTIESETMTVEKNETLSPGIVSDPALQRPPSPQIVKQSRSEWATSMVTNEEKVESPLLLKTPSQTPSYQKVPSSPKVVVRGLQGISSAQLQKLQKSTSAQSALPIPLPASISNHEPSLLLLRPSTIMKNPGVVVLNPIPENKAVEEPLTTVQSTRTLDSEKLKSVSIIIPSSLSSRVSRSKGKMNIQTLASESVPSKTFTNTGSDPIGQSTGVQATKSPYESRIQILLQASQNVPIKSKSRSLTSQVQRTTSNFSQKIERIDEYAQALPPTLERRDPINLPENKNDPPAKSTVRTQTSENSSYHALKSSETATQVTRLAPDGAHLVNEEQTLQQVEEVAVITRSELTTTHQLFPPLGKPLPIPNRISYANISPIVAEVKKSQPISFKMQPEPKKSNPVSFKIQPSSSAPRLKHLYKHDPYENKAPRYKRAPQKQKGVTPRAAACCCVRISQRPNEVNCNNNCCCDTRNCSPVPTTCSPGNQISSSPPINNCCCPPGSNIKPQALCLRPPPAQTWHQSPEPQHYFTPTPVPAGPTPPCCPCPKLRYNNRMHLDYDNSRCPSPISGVQFQNNNNNNGCKRNVKVILNCPISKIAELCGSGSLGALGGMICQNSNNNNNRCQPPLNCFNINPCPGSDPGQSILKGAIPGSGRAQVQQCCFQNNNNNNNPGVCPCPCPTLPILQIQSNSSSNPRKNSGERREKGSCKSKKRRKTGSGKDMVVMKQIEIEPAPSNILSERKRCASSIYGYGVPAQFENFNYNDSCNHQPKTKIPKVCSKFIKIKIKGSQRKCSGGAI